MGKRIDKEFFQRDCLEVAPQLVGKELVSVIKGEKIRLRITETECYRGEEDTACHACKGRTKRTEVLYHEAGSVYVYLCYGMHWLMNIVTDKEENPQCVLIRAGEIYNGPAKLTKRLGVTGEMNMKNICDNDKLWIEDDGKTYDFTTEKRVGIDYATAEYRDKLWRFVMVQDEKNKTAKNK